MWLVFKVHIQPSGSCWSLGERHSCHTGSEEWECQTLAQFFRRAPRFTCAKTFHVLIRMYIHGLCICYAYVWKFSHTKMHSPLLAKPFVRSTQREHGGGVTPKYEHLCLDKRGEWVKGPGDQQEAELNTKILGKKRTAFFLIYSGTCN